MFDLAVYAFVGGSSEILTGLKEHLISLDMQLTFHDPAPLCIVISRASTAVGYLKFSYLMMNVQVF